MQRPTNRNAPTTMPRAFLFHLMLGTLLLTAGCGQGFGLAGTTDVSAGSAPVAAPQNLRIVTAELPVAQRDVPYPATRIQTQGGAGEVAFAVAAGRLPQGLSLTVDGRLIGLPAETGTFPVVVRAKAGGEEADRTFVVPVDAFTIVVSDGLRFGQAWSGRPVRLRALGALGDVAWDLLASDSDGYLVPEADGRARYVPGTVPIEGGVDRVRALDTRTGQAAVVELQVCPDPVAHHVARFGETDVWYVDFEQKEGIHPFAYDWHAALARLGLRSPEGTGSLAGEADQKADLLARKSVLEHLNEHYLRQRDGQAGPRGLRISFPIDRPASEFAMAGPGGWLPAGAARYSVMALTDTDSTGTVGVALRDDGNRVHENNSPGGATGRLGVFVNRIVEHIEGTYRLGSRSTATRPLGPDDVARLDALLYAGHALDARAEDLAYAIEALGRSAAAVLAHEIGHSLGLDHTPRAVEGSLMNTWVSIHPLSEYAFLPEDLAILEQALPGPGRTGAGAAKPTAGPTSVATQMGPTGADVCGPGCSHR